MNVEYEPISPTGTLIVQSMKWLSTFWTIEETCFDSRHGRPFSFPQLSDSYGPILWVPEGFSLSDNETGALVWPLTYLYLTPRIRMNGTTIPLTHTCRQLVRRNIYIYIYMPLLLYVISNFISREARDRGRFRHCATSLEIPISIPRGFLGNFPVTYSFCPHPVALRFTQPLTEIPLRIKCGRSLELETLPSWLGRMSK